MKLIQLYRQITLLIACVGLFSCNHLKKPSRSNTINSLVVSDSAKKPDTVTKSKVRKYKEVITNNAVTDSGLFIIHRIEDKYLVEIPIDLLRTDILVVSRISKAATGNRPINSSLGYAGDQVNESTIQFTTGPQDKVFIKRISFSERSNDSSENGLYRSVYNSNFQPIIASFDIKAYGRDSGSVVVDFTEYLSSDNTLLFFSQAFKSVFSIGSYQNDKSYILKCQSFPTNVEIQSVKTYAKVANENLTYELNTSIIVLPKEQMKPRMADSRIGYFVSQYTDFDSPQTVQVTSMATRWRMEPKNDEKTRYLRGELVEPQKPIVYYVDPATPKKWVPYLIQGVNDWQKAFEKAGFKNAIYALEAPVNNPEWSLFDARHNAIVYKPSVVPNASGPHIHDPRTGEILETHINWYHNVQQLIHDWYMIQAGPNDPQARKMVFDDQLMGQLIRFVVAHEVGHTLGLMHNFGSSSTIPVDSLRSKSYVEQNGFCPSIMDYARFNYVAQPEDNMTQDDLFPRIGVYDEWAIEWGYRWFSFKNQEDEEAFLNNWVVSSLEKDNRLFYGQQMFIITDPRAQSEDLSDDAVKAGNYGIENLKRVMDNLPAWTKEPNKGYNSLLRLQDQVLGQFMRYIYHVSNYIGLYKTTPKTSEQKGNVIEFVSKEKQRNAVKFLQAQVFKTPTWIMNNEIFLKVGNYGPYTSWMIQNQIINYMLDYDRYVRMSYFETIDPKNAYTFDELLNDFETGIWTELESGRKIDFYRSNLQRIYVERLISLCGFEPGNPISIATFEHKNKTAFMSILFKHLNKILSKIDYSIKKISDKESKSHLITLRQKISKEVKDSFRSSTKTNDEVVNSYGYKNQQGEFIQVTFNVDGSIKILPKNNQSCWMNDNPFLRK